MIRDIVEVIPPSLFIALRFGLAAVALGAVGAFRGITRDEMRAGLLIGLPLFVGYAFQFTGQQYTTPSNAGFITGLFVVFTPLVSTMFARRLPSWVSIGAVVVATAGLYLLAVPSGLDLRKGDALVLVTAIAFGFHTVAVARLTPGRSPVRLVAVQLLTTAALATIWTVTFDRQAPPGFGAHPFVWVGIATTGIFATALAFWIQTRQQLHSSPTRTAVILTAEPVFAGIFGFWLAGDRLGARGYVGALLIMGAILADELLAPAEEPA